MICLLLVLASLTLVLDGCHQRRATGTAHRPEPRVVLIAVEQAIRDCAELIDGSFRAGFLTERQFRVYQRGLSNLSRRYNILVDIYRGDGLAPDDVYILLRDVKAFTARIKEVAR